MPWARAQPVTPDDHSELVPLLPIPNRTVKRLCADDSGRTSVKVGHRQAFIAQNPQLTAAGFVFGHANARTPRGRTGCARSAPGTGPLQSWLAQDMNAPRRGLYDRCARTGRLPSRPHAGRLLVTTRPVREALAGMRAAPVYPGCGRYKRLGFAEASAPATSSGLLPLSGARSASDYGTACGLAARNSLIRSTACRKNASSSVAAATPRRTAPTASARIAPAPPPCRPAPDLKSSITGPRWRRPAARASGF